MVFVVTPVITSIAVVVLVSVVALAGEAPAAVVVCGFMVEVFNIEPTG